MATTAQKRKHSFIVVRYRLARKIANAYRNSIFYVTKKRVRFARKARFKAGRALIARLFKLWVKEVVGYENIPSKGPAIFVSNHLSYYDFLIFSAVVPNYVVFLAQKKIKDTFFIRWFTKFNNIIYIDKEYPGTSFFKEVIKYLNAGRLFTIYPEGTRSRTGKMLNPKSGFVKLAMKTSVPLIPVAMKGTYEILPPHKHIPRLRRCKVVIGKKMYISPDNPDFADIFFRRTGERKFGKLTDEELQEIAVRIMDKIRILAEEEWDDSAIDTINRFQRQDIQKGQEFNLELLPQT